MTKRERARLKRQARLYAYAYLNVDRLPAGLPAKLAEYVAGLHRLPDPADDTLAHLLAPYRRVRFVFP